MKTLFTLFILTSLLLPVQLMATEQEPDLLIIDKDTLLIQTFPLEGIDLFYRPFGHMNHTRTDCLRGYRAFWRVVNDSLFLEKIVSCSPLNSFTYPKLKSETKEQSLGDFIKKNSLEDKLVNGKIFADWYSANLYYISRKSIKKGIFGPYLFDERTLVYVNKRHKKIAFKISSGIIKKIE